MSEVKEERITNAEVRGRFFSIPTIQSKICKTPTYLYREGGAKFIFTANHQTPISMVQP